MSDRVRIVLKPLAEDFEVERFTPLQDFLYSYGVEFPCGGHGDCQRCRVRVIEGSVSPSDDEKRILTEAELAQGWRLACRHRAEGPLTLEVEQWNSAILADHAPLQFTPREGLGVAVDVGTTTLVVQLLDLRTGCTLAIRTALNPQVAYGSDVMSRVRYALDGGAARLESAIRQKIGQMLKWDRSSDLPAVTQVVLVGNTVMHHLFCGIDVEPLAHVPFQPVRDGMVTLRAGDLGWPLAPDTPARFLPCLGGFVGSDILAGILATRLDQAETLEALVDLGTNGEIVIGNRDRLLCASTAAGPAFEAGRISMGVRASTGAIAGVTVHRGQMQCRVLGGGTPRGICGSGLVDAVAAGLDLGVIQPSGRLAGGAKSFPLAAPVAVTQGDIRELQLAKGAIAAGLRILMRRWEKGLDTSVETAGTSACATMHPESPDLPRLYLAGAFGNYVNRESARRIGLLDFPEDRIWPSGNTALLGAKMGLFEENLDQRLADLKNRVEHVPLAEDPLFQDTYVEEMTFPEGR
jgi:uncharacterized 2Fe-2S/4Fe-4S cluster protein (DUF4445 family)